MSLADTMLAFKTAINADLGVNDLSATGAVLRGIYDLPPGGRLPFACISAPSIESGQGPMMSEYRREASVDIFVWAGSATTDLDSRTVATETLADEVMTAIETARATPGNALYDLDEFVLSSTLLAGAADVFQDDPIMVTLQAKFSWMREAGV